MSTPDEKFFAWLDGELPADEAARVAAKVACNPELARLAERHRALQAQLKAAFDPVAEEPLPERLSAALSQPEANPEANIVDFAEAKRSRDIRTPRWLPQWTAIAATLAIGIFLGTAIPRSSGSPVEIQSGKLIAAAGLNRALDTELASAPKGDTRIGLTFRDQSDAICRSFTDARASGLACRENGHWQVRGLFAAPEGQTNNYRMAAGMDPNLAALVDSAMAGEPFDAAAEKAAKDRGWK